MAGKCCVGVARPRISWVSLNLGPPGIAPLACKVCRRREVPINFHHVGIFTLRRNLAARACFLSASPWKASPQPESNPRPWAKQNTLTTEPSRQMFLHHVLPYVYVEIWWCYHGSAKTPVDIWCHNCRSLYVLNQPLQEIGRRDNGNGIQVM